jgi:hypothetical protein
MAMRQYRRGRLRHNRASAVDAKTQIRLHVLEAIGTKKAHVFDGFAGDGEMFRRVWMQAASYVGCDLKWYSDEREAFVCDNRRVLRAIDLAPFTVFDVDAFGSPWEQAVIIADRRPVAAAERIGLVLTEDSGLKLKFGSYPAALCELARIRPTAAGGSASGDELIDRAIDGWAKRAGGIVIARWQAERRSGSAVKYVGIVVEGKKKGRAG